MNTDQDPSGLTLDKLRDIQRQLSRSRINCEPTYFIYQYRFPKSKKRRIREKWANDIRNYRNASLPGNPRFGKVDEDAPMMVSKEGLATIRRETKGYMISPNIIT